MNENTLLDHIDHLPDRSYPEGWATFAVLAADPSEKHLVDSRFLGKRLEEIDEAEIANNESILFLEPAATLYFWKKLLRAACRYPDSSLACYLSLGILRHWNQPTPSRAKTVRQGLTDQEVEAAELVRRYVLENSTDSTTAWACRTAAGE